MNGALIRQEVGEGSLVRLLARELHKREVTSTYKYMNDNMVEFFFLLCLC